MRAQEMGEYNDGIPVETFCDIAPRGATVDELVRQSILQHMEEAARATDTPTFEEEDDFEEPELEPYLSDAQLQEMEADWLMEGRASGYFDDPDDSSLKTSSGAEGAENLPSGAENETTGADDPEQ